MVYEFDDFGASHQISDQCMSFDCRDALDQLHAINPAFKVTLFTIPAELTVELADWLKANDTWVETVWHGFYHRSNYECEKMSYQEFATNMFDFKRHWEGLFVNGFRAPGWQISNEIYEWLYDNDFWVADQDYNDERRPKNLKVYKVGSNHHGHVWNCMGNGIFETLDQLKEMVRDTKEFKFVSEAIQ